MNHTYSFKILLLGDPAVGKTSLIHRFIQNSFNSDYKATIGVDIMSKTLQINEVTVKLSLWDIAGQDKFRLFRNVFYRGASAAIIVFDLTRISSFNNLNNWVNELHMYVNVKIPFIIIGNKLDLDYMRNVEREAALKYSEGLRSPYLETSAKTGKGVNECFTAISRQLLKEALTSTRHFENTIYS